MELTRSPKSSSIYFIETLPGLLKILNNVTRINDVTWSFTYIINPLIFESSFRILSKLFLHFEPLSSPRNEEACSPKI